MQRFVEFGCCTTWNILAGFVPCLRYVEGVRYDMHLHVIMSDWCQVGWAGISGAVPLGAGTCVGPLGTLTYIRFGTVHNRRFNLIVPTLRAPNDCAAILRFKGNSQHWQLLFSSIFKPDIRASQSTPRLSDFTQIFPVLNLNLLVKHRSWKREIEKMMPCYGHI